MNIGFVATRLAGTDGVSLEAAKIAEILRGMGHRIAACAGEIAGWGPDAVSILAMHFATPEIRAIHDNAFRAEDPGDVRARIATHAAGLRRGIAAFIADYRIELLVVENALAIPMHLPLGVALRDLIETTGVPTVAHHHDFSWERERFARCAVPDLLERCFPPDLPSIRHIVINSPAQAALQERRGLRSWILPNFLDFETGPPRRADRSARLRRELGIGPGERIIFQPTRVVARKGIERSIDLARRLQESDPWHGYRLLITHSATDEGSATLERLRALAVQAGVNLTFAADRFVASRGVAPAAAGFDLQDAYGAADFVTYPSLVEGFGNAFLEAVFFRRPILVNRYPVYVADIEPLGFRVVAIDGEVTDKTAAAVQRILDDPKAEEAMTAHNYALAAERFSHAVGRRCLESVLATLF